MADDGLLWLHILSTFLRIPQSRELRRLHVQATPFAGRVMSPRFFCDSAACQAAKRERVRSVAFSKGFRRETAEKIGPGRNPHVWYAAIYRRSISRFRSVESSLQFRTQCRSHTAERGSSGRRYSTVALILHGAVRRDTVGGELIVRYVFTSHRCRCRRTSMDCYSLVPWYYFL